MEHEVCVGGFRPFYDKSGKPPVQHRDLIDWEGVLGASFGLNLNKLLDRKKMSVRVKYTFQPGDIPSRRFGVLGGGLFTEALRD